MNLLEKNEWTVKVTFLEPYRIEAPEDKGNKGRKRSDSYADWHQDKSDNKYIPYLRGTLVRSATLKEIEYILSREKQAILNEKVFTDLDCCSGEYQPREKQTKTTKATRRRLNFDIATKVTPCEHKLDACPLCIFLGRLAGNSVAERAVHFEQFNAAAEMRFENPEDLAIKRAVNRVNRYSGKARDYWHIWEIDNSSCRFYTGKISFKGTGLEHFKVLKKIMVLALARINKLAGALCRVDILDDNGGIDWHQNLIKTICRIDKIEDIGRINITEETKPEKQLVLDLSARAKNIADVLEKTGNGQKLRILADKVRSLRSKDPSILQKLPVIKDRFLDEGNNIFLKIDSDKDQSSNKERTLWYKRTNEGQSLAVSLEEAWQQYSESNGVWSSFCRDLGEALYKITKASEGSTEKPERLLGDNYNESQSRIADDQQPTSDILQNSLPKTPLRKTIISGQLTAESPFFLGTETTEEQTSRTIIMDRNGYFRLPRTALRGILRRDLRWFVEGGCNAELDEKKPCNCRLCRIMSRIEIADSKSYVQASPEIRARIRKNPYTKVVEHGALFDTEVGIQGVKFPFRLYYTSPESMLDPSISAVLNMWLDGMLFIGGQQSTGKGVFKLTSFEIPFNCSMKKDFFLSCYHRNFQNMEFDEDNLEKMQSNIVNKPAPWIKIPYQITFGSPVLSKDPVAALDKIQDTVMTKKTVFKYQEGEKSPQKETIDILKGEGVKGAFRYAMGKHDNCLDRTHEECECAVCRITGNKHHAGLLMFSDLEPGPKSYRERTFDHVAVDRPFSLSVEGAKFDDTPLVGDDGTIDFNGVIWLHRELLRKEFESDYKLLLIALADVRDGLIPLGGLSSIGYGQVKALELKEDALKNALKEFRAPYTVLEVKKSKWQRLPGLEHEFPELEADKIYHPYYIVKPQEKVDRSLSYVGHHCYHEGRYTGKLICTLETRGPVFIPDPDPDPDPQGYAAGQDGHPVYDFLRIGGKLAITGSEIRSAVSRVFETLTNSCFRVFDDKYRLSWRVSADNAPQYAPGRIKAGENGKCYIEPMGEVRLPVFDNEEITLHLNEGISKTSESIAKSAQKIREQLIALSEKNPEILSGKREVNFRNNNCFVVYQLGEGRKGYLKLSGPNVVELHRTASNNHSDEIDQKEFEKKYKTIFDVVHNKQTRRGEEDNDVPAFVVTVEMDDGKPYEFVMSKRCERIFYHKSASTLEVPLTVRKRYADLVTLQKNNPQAPPLSLFKTSLPHDELQDGDLIYYRQEKKGQGPVTDIVPVKISRKMAGQTLGNMLLNSKWEALMPCNVSGINERDFSISVDKDKRKEMADLQLPHPDGLCPACSVFGTPFYAHRVGFGFAVHDGYIKWYKDGDDSGKGGRLILKTPQSPRPAWIIPEDGYGEGTSPILGRKFYVHHFRPDALAKDDKEENKEKSDYYSIEALGAENTFRFEVNFDNLSSEELGLLIYSIELEEGLGHKIGKAKPQGLGSVEMTVEKIVCRDTCSQKSMKDKTEDKSSFRDSAFLWLQMTFNQRNWYEISHVKDLINVLMIPPTDIQYRVAYPALGVQNESLDKSLPEDYTYKNLKEIFKSGTASSNQWRLDHFTIPWNPWHPIIFEQTDANEKGESGHSELPTDNIDHNKAMSRKSQRYIEPSEVLWVGLFDKSIEKCDLQMVFENIGTIKDVNIRPTKNDKLFARVTMATIDEAAAAIKIFHGTKIKDQKVTVQFNENQFSKTKK